MAKLLYSELTSLDGMINDEDGGFEWAAPDEEVHAFVNDLLRSIGTHIYGRRLYETMAVWETMPTEGEPPVIADFAERWRAADKVVCSSSLTEVSTPRTTLVPALDADLLRTWKAEATADLLIGGPTVAATAIEAGLVDDYHQIISPVIVGGGTRWLPAGARLDLELVDERRFAGGAVHLHYRPRR